jgi:hypothetical protein
MNNIIAAQNEVVFGVGLLVFQQVDDSRMASQVFHFLALEGVIPQKRGRQLHIGMA